MQELHQEQFQPTPLYGDNDSTLALAMQYNGNHKRVRYILPNINWLMEHTKAVLIRVFRMSTKALCADVGTKYATGTEWVNKRNVVFCDTYIRDYNYLTQSIFSFIELL